MDEGDGRDVSLLYLTSQTDRTQKSERADALPFPCSFFLQREETSSWTSALVDEARSLGYAELSCCLAVRETGQQGRGGGLLRRCG